MEHQQAIPILSPIIFVIPIFLPTIFWALCASNRKWIKGTGPTKKRYDVVWWETWGAFRTKVTSKPIEAVCFTWEWYGVPVHVARKANRQINVFMPEVVYVWAIWCTCVPSVILSICLSICLSVCLSVCYRSSIRLHVQPTIHIHRFLSGILIHGFSKLPSAQVMAWC